MRSVGEGRQINPLVWQATAAAKIYLEPVEGSPLVIQRGTYRIAAALEDAGIDHDGAHVLPSHFVRIRHYGLHHGSCRTRLQQARRLLGMPMELPIIIRLKLLDWLKKILESETDPRLCPFCSKGIMLPVREFAPLTAWRALCLSLIGVFARWQLAAT